MKPVVGASVTLVIDQPGSSLRRIDPLVASTTISPDAPGIDRVYSFSPGSHRSAVFTVVPEIDEHGAKCCSMKPGLRSQPLPTQDACPLLSVVCASTVCEL